MMMARATKEDLDAAMTIAVELGALADGYLNDEEGTSFDEDDSQDCRAAIARLLRLHDAGSLLRVIWGMAVLADPRNEVIDPDADVLQLHPSLVREEATHG